MRLMKKMFPGIVACCLSVGSPTGISYASQAKESLSIDYEISCKVLHPLGERCSFKEYDIQGYILHALIIHYEKSKTFSIKVVNLLPGTIIAEENNLPMEELKKHYDLLHNPYVKVTVLNAYSMNK